MEYESTQAKKLVKLLETSEAQEKAFWARRLKRTILIWLLAFIILIIAGLLVIFGSNISAKQIDFTLHCITHDEFDDEGNPKDPDELILERSADIYTRVEEVELPDSIEGYTFTGRYYNSANYEVEVDPESNIVSSLTPEKALYMQYNLSKYQLSILDNKDGRNNLFQTEAETIGFNKRMFIVPARPYYASEKDENLFIEDKKAYTNN